MYAKTLWYSFLIMAWLCVQSLHAQPVTPSYNATGAHPPPAPSVLRTMATEICNNNIDDDNNRLTDENDFSCYFSAPFLTNCAVTKIIWATNDNGDVYWRNLATGEQNLVASAGSAFLDITWAADGKLYALGGAPWGVWEINPNSRELKFKGDLPDGYTIGNSLTADGAGNLYLDAYSIGRTDIIKLNIATWKACFVADLEHAGLSSAGDLTFMNGDLYLSCANGNIAKINVKTGKIQTFFVAGGGGWYGLTTTGDGDFYVNDRESIYRIDTKTMTFIPTPVFTFKNVDNIFGLAAYSEICQAPKCPTEARITTIGTGPYCSNTRVFLVADGAACNKGIGTYQWTTPSGNTSTDDTLQAMEPGMYYLNYQPASGTCASRDSFYVKFLNVPVIKLGNDTSVCEEDDVYLTLTDTTGITRYTWQDGSTGSFLIAPGPGLYWVDAGNKCGNGRDSIKISAQTSGCERFVAVPSAFSPNGDGRNDVFKPIAKGNFSKFEFTVYNRWGQMVFKTNEINHGWDGSVNGFTQSAGLFTWVCRYEMKGKEPRTIKGTVTIIK